MAEVRSPLFAVVLAGGRGSRMGAAVPKPLLEIGGRPLIECVLAVLRPHVDEVVISTNEDEAFAPLGVSTVADDVPGNAGPLAGLLAASRWFTAREARAFRLLSVAGDTPFLPPDLVARLVAEAGPDGSIAVAAHAGRLHPITALWPSSVLVRLRIDPDAPRRDRSLRSIQEAHACHAVDFARAPDAPGGDPFFNVNTPADLTLARATMKIAG